MSVRIAVLMPITSPFMFTSGPPELPGLMAASVWINDWNCRLGTMLRPLAETIPAVTVSCSPNGLPTANTQSPTCMPSELPSFAVGSGLSLSILITARSVS